VSNIAKNFAATYLESKETGFQHLLIACDVSEIDEAVADEASLSCL
jgi:hypothetical protein